MPPSVRPYLFFLVAVALWAATPTVADRLFSGRVSPLSLLATSGSVAAATLTILAAAIGRLRAVRLYTPRDWLAIAGTGLLGIVGYLSFYMTAFTLAPPDGVNVVNYLWPIFLVLFAGPILGERCDRWTWLGVGLSFLGAAGILTGWGFGAAGQSGSTGLTTWEPTHLLGYACAAVGAVFWGLFSAISKRLPYDQVVAMALYWVVGAAVFSIALSVRGVEQWPSASEWTLLICFGVFVNGFATVCWLLALAGGPTAVIGNLVYVTPFLSLLYLRVFRGIPLRAGVWLSLILIVTGCLIALNRARARTTNPAARDAP